MARRMEETLETFYPNEKNEVLLNPLIFGDYKDALNEDVKQLYEDYESYENVREIFENVTNVYVTQRYCFVIGIVFN